MAGVLKYTRKDLASLVYHPVRPLDVISDEIGIPVQDIAKVSHAPLQFWPRMQTHWSNDVQHRARVPCDPCGFLSGADPLDSRLKMRNVPP